MTVSDYCYNCGHHDLSHSRAMCLERTENGRPCPCRLFQRGGSPAAPQTTTKKTCRRKARDRHRKKKVESGPQTKHGYFGPSR